MRELKALQRLLSEGRISRRAFLSQATALGAAAAIPAGLWAAEARAAAPKRGGHMRIGSLQGSTTDSLDPTKLTSGFTNFLFYTFTSQLTEVNAGGQLAERNMSTFVSKQRLSERSFEPIANQPSGFW